MINTHSLKLVESEVRLGVKLTQSSEYRHLLSDCPHGHDVFLLSEQTARRRLLIDISDEFATSARSQEWKEIIL